MTNKEYVGVLSAAQIDEAKVSRVCKAYGANFPDVVKKILSSADECVFLDGGYRVLSLSEIMDAEKDLHVQFKEKGILPLVDCEENDFIVYHYEDDFWSKFNIVDETVFKKKNSLAELLK